MTGLLAISSDHTDSGSALLTLAFVVILGGLVVWAILGLAVHFRGHSDVHVSGEMQHRVSGTVRHEVAGTVQHQHVHAGTVQHVHQLDEADRERLDQLAAWGRATLSRPEPVVIQAEVVRPSRRELR